MTLNPLAEKATDLQMMGELSDGDVLCTMSFLLGLRPEVFFETLTKVAKHWLSREPERVVHLWRVIGDLTNERGGNA